MNTTKKTFHSHCISPFLSKKLKAAKQQPKLEPKDVVLYGFGRIGRLVARELMGKSGSGSQLRLRAIVTRDKLTPTILEKRAALLTKRLCTW